MNPVYARSSDKGILAAPPQPPASSPPPHRWPDRRDVVWCRYVAGGTVVSRLSPPPVAAGGQGVAGGQRQQPGDLAQHAGHLPPSVHGGGCGRLAWLCGRAWARGHLRHRDRRRGGGWRRPDLREGHRASECGDRLLARRTLLGAGRDDGGGAGRDERCPADAARRAPVGLGTCLEPGVDAGSGEGRLPPRGGAGARGLQRRGGWSIVSCTRPRASQKGRTRPSGTACSARRVLLERIAGVEGRGW